MLLVAHSCIHAGRFIISSVLDLLQIWSVVFNSLLEIPFDLSCFSSTVIDDGMVGVVVVVAFISVMRDKISVP